MYALGLRTVRTAQRNGPRAELQSLLRTIASESWSRWMRLQVKDPTSIASRDIATSVSDVEGHYRLRVGTVFRSGVRSGRG